jgi:2-polyprenyl-6-methoxyphenol hydroxylase-like FAD-dependent oxidoreductase
VDQFGARIAGIDQAAIRSVLKDRYLSILRGDLVNEVYRTVADRAEFVITSIEQSAADVRATFVRTRPRQFDLLIGADGLHSTLRHLAFGTPLCRRSRRVLMATLEPCPRKCVAAVGWNSTKVS